MLFVITSVAEQVSSHFDSVARDHLATIRFPLYYLFGGATLGFAVACSIATTVLSGGSMRKRQLLILVLVLMSSAGAALDYQFVYCPLQESITPAGSVRTEAFTVLHHRSRNANAAHVGLALLASILACVPGQPNPKHTTCETGH